MNIGFVANESKKKLIQNFCIAYRAILAKHELFATGTLGGEQQMGAQIENNDIDLVIFMRDPSQASGMTDVHTLVRLCDNHNIPLATNLATAELLIKALDRGDLDWREFYK